MKRLLLITALLIVLFAFLFLFMRTPNIPLEALQQRYANSASQFASIAGMQVHFRDEGPRTDSLPLVLLHGTASSLHTWDSLMPFFSHKRIIRLDLPGYGLTGPHPQSNYRSAMYHAVLDTLLQQRGVARCIVAGNSLGGFLAWTYALDRPQVQGIILINPGGFTNKAISGSVA